MRKFYITNGTIIIPCNSLKEACALAVLKDWEEEKDNIWKVCSVRV